MKSQYRYSNILILLLTVSFFTSLGGLGHAAGKPKPPPPPAINPVIVYTIISANGTALAVANADGSNQKVVLANGAFNCAPNWSPDGNHIVFGGALPTPGIYRLQINRNTAQAVGAPVQIAALNGSCGSPVWSPGATPDGTERIAYTDVPSGENDARIYLVDPNQPTDKFQLSNLSLPGLTDGTPTWSPDSTQIAFSYGRDNSKTPPYDIQIITLRTTGCPLGQSLCEGATRMSLVRDVVGSALAAADTILNARWGNTGAEIAVSAHIPSMAGNSDIWAISTVDTIDADIGDARNLTNTNRNDPPDRHETLPTWSPDDSQIAHRAVRSLCNNKPLNGIVLRNVEGALFPDGCEEQVLIKDGNFPSWWRGLPQP